jgi:hypothetical protein
MLHRQRNRPLENCKCPICLVSTHENVKRSVLCVVRNDDCCDCGRMCSDANELRTFSMTHSQATKTPPATAKPLAIRTPLRPDSLKPSLTCCHVDSLGASGRRWSRLVGKPKNAPKKKPAPPPNRTESNHKTTIDVRHRIQAFTRIKNHSVDRLLSRFLRDSQQTTAHRRSSTQQT